jgi:hypothetical protein
MYVCVGVYEYMPLKLFLCANLQRYIIIFSQDPAVFIGGGVSLHFSAYQDALLIFQKKKKCIRNMSFLHLTLTILDGLSCGVISRGPKSGITNSKKIKKLQDLCVMSFYLT